MTLTAAKLVYDRKTKTYRVEVASRTADPIMVHSGHYVFQDAGKCLSEMRAGGLFGSGLKGAKREAMLAFLAAEADAAKAQPKAKVCPVYGTTWIVK